MANFSYFRLVANLGEAQAGVSIQPTVCGDFFSFRRVPFLSVAYRMTTGSVHCSRCKNARGLSDKYPVIDCQELNDYMARVDPVHEFRAHVKKSSY
jgi:hypothetical protein